MGRTRYGDSPRKDNTAQLVAPPSSMKVASFPSPSSSSSSSDFEFNVALSPSSKRPCSHLCPADELFYKGQLLPLHLPPRISMVRALLLASSSTSSSSDTTTTASRDSNGSSSSSFSADLQDCDSSRPSSVNEEEARRVGAPAGSKRGGSSKLSFFATRFSSVFLHRGSKKDQNNVNLNMNTPILTSKKANVSSISSSSSSSSSFSSSSSSAAKGVIKKCVKKVKPLYDKLSSMQQKPNPLQQPQQKKTFSFSIKREKFTAGSFSGKKLHGADRNCTDSIPLTGKYSHPKSFSGNLGEPRRKDQWATSCPSSIRSSPSHSGLLCLGGSGAGEPQFLLTSSSTSSIDELQNAIQGAIAHCKSTMTQSMNQKKASGRFFHVELVEEATVKDLKKEGHCRARSSNS